MRGAVAGLALATLGVLAAGGAAAAKTVTVPITFDGEVPVRCAVEPLGTCHNRWHPDIPAVAEADPGDTVVFQTRDAFDNQFSRGSSASDVMAANLNLVHPLTGPVHVRGARAGDVLAVRVEDIAPGPDRFGYTVIVPGFGFLRDVFPDPFIVRWDLDRGGEGGFVARSRDMPGVGIPIGAFAGTIGVALGPSQTEAAFQREADLAAAGGFVLQPQDGGAAFDAVPQEVCGPDRPAASRCLRTVPPRENGGNMDVKQMVKGTTLLFPCFVDGCLLSVGDVHFAQGDGEVSGTAIEMNAVVTVKLQIRRGQAAHVPRPQIEGTRKPGILKRLEPDRFLATTGMPLKPAGEANPQLDYLNSTLVTGLANLSEDVTVAARDALLHMIDLLTGPNSPAPVSLSREQAYVLSSVAVDLRISNLVDTPNFVVTAFLPLDVFERTRRRARD
ncbi:MAG TPA: acetamidase/formamidase family protein [Thermodesulfobacteriota bacterium]